MRRFYLISFMMLACLGATAQVEPNVKPEAPVSGQKYVLVNKAMSPTQYMSRTSWDGALYYLGEADSHYADYALTAVDNEDGSWSFTLDEDATVETGEYDEEGNAITETTVLTKYLYFPYGSPNANMGTDVATWYLDAKDNGYYHLILGEGHNDNAMSLASYTTTKDLRMHLNNGCQYFVVTYYGGPWYPDCYGGITEEYDESTGDTYFSATDSISFNWGFVPTEKIPEFMIDFQAYGTMTNYYNTYIANESYPDYLTGFKASYDAAAAIYKGSEYNWEEDIDIIVAMLNSKVSFYKEIESALLIEDPSAALTKAISDAQSHFATATSTAEVEQATATLKSAVQAFKEGTGDLTAMGTNMSFEDLSSQGGSETSSIADVPTGWNMFINGNQVFTANDIRSNGITAWCGINSDSEGTPKDGNESFGIWTSGVPIFELSQSIEGLENGTYLIGAGLMAGANGNGSRLTTQRIFGNLNSTYYGDESMYDSSELDQSEVYAFAGNAEVSTDREMFPVEVRAYVWDGTLTFGVRTDGNIAATFRTSGNGAGGDGWFKVDNFTIKKLGYVGEDAAAVANHFVSVVENYMNTEVFQKSIEDEISQILGSPVTADTPAADINNVITSLKDKISLIESSIAAYNRLSEAIETGYNEAENYSYAPSIDELMGAIETAEIALDERNVDEAGIDEIINNINTLIGKVKSEAVQEGEYANVIVNPSFEDLSAQGGNNSDGASNPPAGWTLKLNGVECATNAEYGAAGANMGWCAINGGDVIDDDDEEGNHWTVQYTDGNHLWGIWAADVPEVELSQTISGLPAGTYTLSCDMIVQWNWGGQCLTTQRIFANKYVQMFGAEDTYSAHPTVLTEDMSTAKKCDTEYPDATYKHMTYAGHYQSGSYGVTSCPRPMEMTFGLGEGEDLHLGFRTNNVDVEQESAHPYDSAGWFKLDNFKLLYVSSEVPSGTDATSISSIEGNSLQLVGRQYFTADGMEVSHPVKGGVTLIKNHFSDGSVKTTKVVVR